MQIVVIGPGALGCLLAAALSAPGTHTVSILDHDRNRAALINAQGILLEEGTAEQRLKVQASTDPVAIAATDCILLCVKSHQVATALAHAAPLLAAPPLVIGFQNGIGHLASMTAYLAPDQWAAGVTTQGATLLGPGHVRHGGSGPTRIGFFEAVPEVARERLDQVAAALTSAGISTEATADIRDHIWGKLLVNVGINALTAILDCPNGDLLASPSARQRMQAAVIEAARVATALGVSLPEDPVARVLEVCRATGANISSMLQDLRNRRRTEIDAINGAVLTQGRRLGIPMPVNEALVREVKALEKGYLDDSA